MSECGGLPATTMNAVQQLIAKKDAMEAQIKAYYDVLEDVSELA